MRCLYFKMQSSRGLGTAPRLKASSSVIEVSPWEPRQLNHPPSLRKVHLELRIRNYIGSLRD